MHLFIASNIAILPLVSPTFVLVQPGITITTEVNNIPPGGEYQSHRSENRTQESTSRTKDIRNAYPSGKIEDVIRYLPGADQLSQPKQKAPAFLRNMIDSLSRDLGDHDHIASNISQANRLYRNSDISEESFMQALYEARATAKRATQIKYLNSNGGMNRMPYFFRCLLGALKQETAISS